MLQVDHEAYKAEADRRSKASQEECSQLREKVDMLTKEAASLHEKLRKLGDSTRDATDAQTAGTAKAAVRFLTLDAALPSQMLFSSLLDITFASAILSSQCQPSTYWTDEVGINSQ